MNNKFLKNSSQKELKSIHKPKGGRKAPSKGRKMTQTQTKTKNQIEISYPSRYKVIIYNNDVTPVDYVLQLLVNIFNKTIKEASNIVEQIHNNGKGVAGLYSLEVAQQKVNECIILNAKHNYPLDVDLEEA